MSECSNVDLYLITERLNQVLLPATFLFAVGTPSQNFQRLRIAIISSLAMGSVNYLSMLHWSNKNISHEKSAENKEFLRYVDWLITTPTNVYVVWYYSAVEQQPEIEKQLPLWQILLPVLLSNFCSLASFCTKTSGSKRANNPYEVTLAWQVLGYIFLAISIMQVVKLSSLIDLKLIPFFLIGTWIAYNIGALLPSAIDRAIVFNLTDLFAKIIFVYYFSFNFTPI